MASGFGREYVTSRDSDEHIRSSRCWWFVACFAQCVSIISCSSLCDSGRIERALHVYMILHGVVLKLERHPSCQIENFVEALSCCTNEHDL